MLTARNSVHKSATFGRNCFSHRTSRKGDSPPVTLLSSFQDPLKPLKGDATKSRKDLASLENEEQSLSPAKLIDCSNSSAVETLITDKRAAKRRRQKEKRVKQHCKINEDYVTEFLSCDMVGNDLRNEGDVDLSKSDLIESSSGERCKSEALGLAFVKNSLSLSNSDISECSESLSLELDGEEGENAKPEQFETGSAVVSASALHLRSSVTDSSGVETSSDADSERQTFATNSSASSVKDHSLDAPDDCTIGCEDEGDSLSSLQWNPMDGGFTTVTKKRRMKSLKLMGEDKKRTVINFSVPTCDKNSCHKDQNYGVSNLNSCADVIASKSISKPLEKALSCNGLSHTEPDAVITSNTSQYLSSLNVEQDSSSDCLLAENSHSSDDNVSVYMDDVSSEMGLSQYDFDYAMTFAMQEREWTVVKMVRRSKSGAQSNSSLGEFENEDRKGLSVHSVRCSGDVVNSNGVRGFSKDRPADTVVSQDIRFTNNHKTSNFKNFERSSYKNTPQGVHYGISKKDGYVGKNFNSSLTSQDAAHRNLSRSSSLNEHHGPTAVFKEHSRFGLKKFISMNTNGANSNCCSDAKRASVSVSTSTREVSRHFDCAAEKSSLSQKESFDRTAKPYHCNRTLVEEFCSAKRFDVQITAKYIESEYQKVLEVHQKDPHLVVFFNPRKDV